MSSILGDLVKKAKGRLGMIEGEDPDHMKGFGELAVAFHFAVGEAQTKLNSGDWDEYSTLSDALRQFSHIKITPSEIMLRLTDPESGAWIVATSPTSPDDLQKLTTDSMTVGVLYDLWSRLLPPKG